MSRYIMLYRLWQTFNTLCVLIVQRGNSHYAVVGVDFFPLVAEILGGLAKDSIGKALGQRSNPLDPQTTIKHLLAVLLLLRRGNACL